MDRCKYQTCTFWNKGKYTMRAIDRFERFGTPVHNGQDFLKNHIPIYLLPFFGIISKKRRLF